MPQPLSLALLLGSLATLAAYEPAGDLAELSDLSRLIHARPGMQGRMFSSYDRRGGNDDGFRGTYSQLRVQDGNSVLAEMSGPGAIQRIWFTHTDKADGLLARKREHLRIFIDGGAEPAVDLPLEEVLSGRNPRFPSPLAGSGMGGFYCYVPIPFRSSCRVEVQGTTVRFYHIQWNQFAATAQVKPFSMTLGQEDSEKLARAVQVWSRPGDLEILGPFPDRQRTSQAISLAPGASTAITLPAGSRLVRAIELEAKSGEWPAWTGARLAATWDDAPGPGLDLPIEYFFAQAMQPSPFRSLMAGAIGDEPRRFYNLYPMPYRQGAILRLTAPAGSAISGTLAVTTTPLPGWADDLLYAHASYHEALPTVAKIHYPWLVRQARGHFAGVYLATTGKGALPGWLEGDEVFTCDGEMRIHGTGSEDYFNCGWYGVKGRLDTPGTRPTHGFPVYDHANGLIRACAFRWHLGDVVPFERQIRAEIEHGPVNELAVDYRSATFWYDDRPALEVSGR